MPTLQELIKFELCGYDGLCHCRDSETRRADPYSNCHRWAERAECVVARLKKPITELLIESPSISPECASPEKREEWRRLIEDKLGYATVDAARLLNPNDPYSNQGWGAFILAMWDYVRKQFEDMIGDDPTKQRILRVARRLAEAEGHDPDLVSMGMPNQAPYRAAKNTTALTAPMQPVWTLYWREAEAAIALIDEDNDKNRGFS